MKSSKKLLLAASAGVAVLALTIGLAAFGLTSTARASETTGQPGISHRGGPLPFPGLRGQGDTFLAEALGISQEELQAAQTAAYEAAIDQALADGLITQAQADQLKGAAEAGRLGHGSAARFAAGYVFGPDSAIDMDALLAEALGISVDELNSAREAAQSARLEQAVAEGIITQEGADLMAARQALQAYLDPQALMAEALGISEETLQAYRDEGMSMIDILGETGLTASQFMAARQAAFEAAVQQAVEDGVITETQAEQVILSGARGLSGGRGGRGGFGLRPDRGGFPLTPGSSTTPEAGDTNL